MAKKKTVEPWQAKLGVSGLNPLAVMDLQDAVKAEKETAVLDGRKFLIKYVDEKTIFYKPEEGFAPCGYILTKRLLSD